LFDPEKYKEVTSLSGESKQQILNECDIQAATGFSAMIVRGQKKRKLDNLRTEMNDVAS
jgi:hypothetical protein